MTPPTVTLPELPSMEVAGELKLDIPEDLELPDLSKIADDPELMEMAALETWRRIISHHWQNTMNELWERNRRGDKSRLTEITGMSRSGARRRGSLNYDEAMKASRRRRPPTRTED